MANEMAWSRQEAAILLDGYIEVIKENLPRSYIIKRVSTDLRKMAVNNGIEIDDIFRNKNGIYFQLQSMESAYCGVTVMKPATRLFAEIVALYNDNRGEYEILLKGAKAVIDGKSNYKDSFSSWLAIALPSASINALLASYNTIENFCLKLKVLKAPLFETTDIDILKSVQKTVSQNKIFRIVNKKQLKMIDTAMTSLLKYRKENALEKKAPELVQDVASLKPLEKATDIKKVSAEVGSSESTPYVRTEQDRRLIVKYPLIYKRIFSVLYEDKEAVTIAALYNRINHIARCADIEDILDNVSWSKCERSIYYTFSEELVCHDELVDASGIENEIISVSGQAASGTNVADFNCLSDYSYTRPVSFSYFGNTIINLSSWTDLYAKLVSTLYEDYSNIIPVGKSFTGSGRADFGNKDIARAMTAPKPVYMQMYLETNLSATNIIAKLKALLDLCQVDYENVVIEYQKKTDNITAPHTANKQKSTEVLRTIDSKSFDLFLRGQEGMADATCRSYASAIGIAERFAREHQLEHYQLFTSDLNEAKSTVDTLLSNPEFIEYNKQQHNRFRAAMKKYLLFLRADQAVASTEALTPIRPSNPQPIANEEYREVLMQNFQKGFRLGSPIEIRKFRRGYEQMNGKPLDDDDATIECGIKRCGIRFEDKVFVPQTMLGDDARDRLFAYIRKSFNEGKTALYYQAIFNEFSEDFLDYFIYNTDMLKEYLSYLLGEDYFFGRSYMSKDADTTADPIDEVRTCLREYAMPMTYDAMYENLPHIPQQKIKQILATNNEFVSNGRGEYLHVSAVNLSHEELDNITEIITEAIDDKNFLSGNELIDAIKSKYPYIYEKNDIFSMVGLRDTIKYHLCRKFSFSGNIISKSGSSLTMTDVFADYCGSRDSFTIDELNVLAGELGTVIYFDPVYENSLRVDHDHFVSKARAHFNIPDTDKALDLFCTSDYTSIGKVTGFSLFPNAGFPWNEYLLEHYVAAYSERYMLLHTGFNANSCVGAIVKKSARFESFDDCIVAVLAASDILLKKQTALQYLCDEGFIARRIYTNIEELLIRATAQRSRKEAN